MFSYWIQSQKIGWAVNKSERNDALSSIILLKDRFSAYTIITL